MERSAVTASFGAKDENLRMVVAFSFSESMITLVLLSGSGMTSSRYCTPAVMYGS